MNLRTKEGFEAFLEGNVGNIAFLRFEVEELKQGHLSDWDIAVKNRSQALIDCETVFGIPWLRIPREYVVQHYYEWGQVDLLPTFQWNGFEYLRQDRFWERVSKSADGVPRPTLGHDAYITWMTGLLWGGRFNPRYSELIKAGATKDEEIFRESLEEAFGSKLAAQLFQLAVEGKAEDAVKVVPKMRSALRLRRVLSEPGLSLKSVFKHWICELKFHLNPPFPWIGILGADGSGKSTVIDGLAEKLKISRVGFKGIHWIPQLSKKAEVSVMVVPDPHSNPPKCSFLSVLQLGKIVLVWWIALLKDLLHLRAKKAMVLSDRCYPDLLADPRRYRYGASLMFARWAFKLIPKPDRVIVLLTEPEIILKRKQEVTPDELVRQLTVYRSIAEEWGETAVIVDCGQEPDVVIQEALDVLVDSLAKRSR